MPVNNSYDKELNSLLFSPRPCPKSIIRLSGLKEFSRLMSAIAACMVAALAPEDIFVEGMDILFRFLKTRPPLETSAVVSEWDDDPSSATLMAAVGMVTSQLDHRDIIYYRRKREVVRQRLLAAGPILADVACLLHTAEQLRAKTSDFAATYQAKEVETVAAAAAAADGAAAAAAAGADGDDVDADAETDVEEDADCVCGHPHGPPVPMTDSSDNDDDDVDKEEKSEQNNIPDSPASPESEKRDRSMSVNRILMKKEKILPKLRLKNIVLRSNH